MKVKKSLYLKIGIITSLAVIALLVWQFGFGSSAVYDSDSAVHINPDDIENSTLIIGTHLIYIHSLSDELYEIAQDSASASGQESIYYKSELAGGLWFDITDATSISDISSQGTIVSNDEIAALDVTHHTKSDGITYDLRTNQAVCIFDIYNVYDLENMEELEPLKLQYDTMKESGSGEKTTKRNIEYTQWFFSTSVTNNTTSTCDDQLAALQKYYEELVANGAASSDTEMVLKVMSKVDNERKAAVFTIVDEALSTLQDRVADVSEDEDLRVDDTLATAIGNSQSTLGESMTEAEGNMLAEGDTVLSQKEYELSNGMILNAWSNNFSGCDDYNYKLQYLDNINNGRIVDSSNELSLLDELITSADTKYTQQLSAGQTAAYNELVNRNASNAALQSRIKSDVVDANAARGELQFLLQSKTDRMESSDAQDYINQRISGISTFRTAIKSDDYKTSLNDNVDQYQEWLSGLLKDVKDEGTTQSESDSLYEQKASLQEQKLTALDNLDLDTAKRIDAQLEALDSQIDQVENAASSKLQALLSQKAELEAEIEAGTGDEAALQTQLSTLEAQIADSSSDMNSESLAANVMNAKSEIMDAVAEGSTSEATIDMISNNVDLLTSAVADGSTLALEALKSVYNKMLSKSEIDGISSYDDMLDSIEEAVAESVVTTSLSGELSVSDATDTLAESLGVDSLFDEDGNISSDVTEDDLAAVLIALGDFNKKTGGVSSSSEGSGSNGSGSDGNGSNGSGTSGDGSGSSGNGTGTNNGTNADNSGNGNVNNNSSNNNGSADSNNGSNANNGNADNSNSSNANNNANNSNNSNANNGNNSNADNSNANSNNSNNNNTNNNSNNNNTNNNSNANNNANSDNSNANNSNANSDNSNANNSNANNTNNNNADSNSNANNANNINNADNSNTSNSNTNNTDSNNADSNNANSTDSSNTGNDIANADASANSSNTNGDSNAVGDGMTNANGNSANSTTDNSNSSNSANDNSNNSNADSQTSDVAAFTDGIISGLNQSGDGLVFQTRKQGDESYIPAKILAQYAGYRYVWNDTKKTAILSKGRKYYSFTAFKETVENEKADILYMNAPASFSGDVYIPSSFVEENFGCSVSDISGTSYSVLVNDKVVEKSQQLLSELLEKGGYY
jgi:hypothetical protein